VETQAFEDTTAKPGDHWCYAVRTVASSDPAVESADSNEACVEVKDLSPPAVPSGLTAIVRDNVVELSWSPSAEPDVVAYRVYRSPAGALLRCVMDNRLADVPAGETSYHDRLLRPGTAYLYAVAARDRGGNESPCSAEAEGGIQ
jgi:fibronectin type 3 domain-containing protein